MTMIGPGLRHVFGLSGAIISLVLFSFVVNILLLVQPLYMLQVYDRVLLSSSLATLGYISVLAALALILLGVLDAIRSMICGRIGAALEKRFGAEAFVASMKGPRASLGDVQPLRDLATLRAFLSGRALLAFIDLPFAPIFIAVLYLIHPNLFWLTLAGAVVLACLALANQQATRKSAAEAGERTMRALLSAQSFVRSTESLEAMGMVGHAVHAWGADAALSLNAQDRMNRINATFAGISRTLRMGLQIAILGYGGYLVIAGDMTAGMIFASSLISGRALQPIDQVIAGWKGVIDTRKAWTRLNGVLKNAVKPKRTDLPAPHGRLTLENVVVYPAFARGGEPLIKRISADIAAGDFVVVIGSSGAGKSTLMRAIVGGLDVRSGAVRIDGADIRNWDREKLGRHIGYLAQDVDLLPGTIAQNIARFDPTASDVDIIEAAGKAKVHDLVQKLPHGYDTVIGPGGQQLSGGQRQRIGLARAFFGSPRILVLDEPNANLDADGEEALEASLVSAHADGVTILLVTQRRQIGERADKLMILNDGLIAEFGLRDEIAARQTERLRVVQESRRRASNDRADGQQPRNETVTGRFSPVVLGGRTVDGTNG